MSYLIDMILTPEYKCRFCQCLYDRKDVRRVYGKDSAPYLYGFCSAQCYTQHVINEK